MPPAHSDVYSIIIEVHPDNENPEQPGQDWRLGDISVDWVDLIREKSSDRARQEDDEHQETDQVEKHPAVPGAMTKVASKPSPRHRKKKRPESIDDLSLQPLLAHIAGPNPFEASSSSGVTHVGNGVVHLFKHAPPAGLIARLEGQNGEASSGPPDPEGWADENAEGGDGSLIAILAVPAWMRPADLIEFLGGWATCLEGVRMIRWVRHRLHWLTLREATTPNRSIVLLKFRDPLQASDFMVIFTGKAFSTLEPRETCHPIRVHHLVLHRLDASDIPVPAFPPSVYESRARALPQQLKGVQKSNELPSCPVCLERLDSTVTGLVTLPCAHTFDCDCLRKWGDSRCPVCRVSHLLLSSAQGMEQSERDRITRATQCGMCDSAEHNWMCVVCGSVGCGRYSKGHARRHWKETGHVLAMELETQRVWDYEGDNYVHRLIQSRADGKLVELPSASSLAAMPSRPLPLNRPLDESDPSSRSTTPVTSSPPRPRGTPNTHQHTDSTGHAGPSSNDVEKISTIESITLEYSYLLSSQLESMRQHYEAQMAEQASQIEELRAEATRAREIQERVSSAERQRQEAEQARERAERKAEKALEISRALQQNLGSERAMSQGLSSKITKLTNDLENVRAQRDAKSKEVDELNDTVRDLMFTLEAGMKLQVEGEEGGDLVVKGGKGKKKKK